MRWFILLFLQPLYGAYDIQVNNSQPLLINADSIGGGQVIGSTNFPIFTFNNNPPPMSQQILVTLSFSQLGGSWSAFDNLQLNIQQASQFDVLFNPVNLVINGATQPTQNCFITTFNTITHNGSLNFSSSNRSGNSVLNGSLTFTSQAN